MHKKQNIILYLFLFGGLLLCMPSCVSTHKLVYLQGAEQMFHYPREIEQYNDLNIQPDDRLYITVSAADKELLDLFGNTQLLGSTGNNASGMQQISGLLVDKEGNIQVPILGSIHAGGLTCNELADEVKKLLVSGDYIKNPVVNVQIRNFRVTVLGEVRSPGVKELPSNRITLLDALGMAGDLLPTARRDNILVVREENGERIAYTVDLTSAENMFDSPVFFLRQNDYVQVEPNKSIGVRGSSTLPALSATGSVVSVLASILSLTLTIIYLNKK